MLFLEKCSDLAEFQTATGNWKLIECELNSKSMLLLFLGNMFVMLFKFLFFFDAGFANVG